MLELGQCRPAECLDELWWLRAQDRWPPLRPNIQMKQTFLQLDSPFAGFSRLIALWVVVCSVLVGCASNATVETPVRTRGIGNTQEEARAAAFRQAIELKVGALVLSTQQSDQYRLVRNDVMVHSAGYVDDFRTVSSGFEGGRAWAVLDVWVSSSRIADRLLGAGPSSTSFQGNRHEAQLTTFRDARTRGDAALKVVLEDFPQKAFSVSQGAHVLRVDGHRRPIVVIPYTLRWHYPYIVAINEAMRRVAASEGGGFASASDKTVGIAADIADAFVAPILRSLAAATAGADPALRRYESIRQSARDRIQPPAGTVLVVAKDPNALLIGERSQFRMNDEITMNLVRQTFRNRRPLLHVSLNDFGGRELLRACLIPPGVDSGPYFYSAGDDVVIDGNRRVSSDIVLGLSSVSEAVLRAISQVEIRIVSDC